VDSLAQLLVSDSPWLLVVAGLLLVAALFLARQLWASVRRLGARIGEMERVSESERTRRRQVEAVLQDEGIPLPYWPPDGPHQPAAARFPAQSRSSGWPAPPRTEDFPADDEDEPYADEGENFTREHGRIPVPPLPESERQRLARHRR
jgi:hypothetical protein